MLKELAEYGHRREEKVKAMKSEIEANAQGTKSRGKEIGTHIDSLDPKEETNVQAEQNEPTGIQKIEEMVRNLCNTLKGSYIRILGVAKGEGEEQEMEKVSEQIMKEHFPNLAKEMDFQEVQEAQRVPKK